MPPEGYETVTLPADLVQELDGLPLGDSRTGIVRSLVAYYREGESKSDDEDGLTATVEVDADDVADTVVAQLEQSDYEDFDDWFSPDVARTIAEHVVEDMNIDETRKAAKQAEANTEEIKRQLEAIQGAMV